MKSIFLPPGKGRLYLMGRISAVFKADGDETAKRYSISDAPKGSFVLVPAAITHDFQNRSSRRAGILNFSIPGEFEKDMPAIAEWFAENPPQDARP